MTGRYKLNMRRLATPYLWQIGNPRRCVGIFRAWPGGVHQVRRRSDMRWETIMCTKTKRKADKEWL